MKKFKVTASSISYYTVEVEAETEHEATMIARDIDGGDFIPKSGVVEGDWQIDGAEEIKL